MSIAKNVVGSFQKTMDAGAEQARLELERKTEQRQRQREEAEDRQRERGSELKPRDLTMGPGYDRIIDAVFVADAAADYDELEQGLKLSMRASRADYGTLVDALDASEDQARRALQLLVNAEVAHDAFEIDAKAIRGAMRDQASAVLQKQKDEGQRSKSITNDDVEAVMASQFPDEWRELEARSSKAKRMLTYLRGLADRWSERCKDLRQMVARAREV